MHLLLTDRLACPRCGPAFGLILLAERMDDRRVLDGALGCPNCRDRFPVTDGFGDLRPPPRSPLPEPSPAPAAAGKAAGSPMVEPEEEVVRLAALLGVARGPGHLLLVGRRARRAAELADLLEDVEIVALHPELAAESERSGVSRIAAGPGLPFFDRSLRGVALHGGTEADLLEESLRVVGAGGRVVVEEAGPGVEAVLEEAGFQILLRESGVVVGLRAGPRRPDAGGGVALPVFPGPPPGSGG